MRRMRILFVLVGVFSLAAAGCGSFDSPGAPGQAVGQAPAQGLTVSLRSDRAAVLRGEPLTVRFILSNHGLTGQHVLIHRTPLAGIDANLLEVMRDGQPVAYTGKLVKRPAPTAADFVEVPAGGAVSVSFDPATVYDMTQAGTYTLRYRAPYVEVRGTRQKARSARPTYAALSSNQVSVWFEGRAVAKKGKPGGGGGGNFNRCSGDQMTTINIAEENATTISTMAHDYLETDTTDSRQLYRTWFDARANSPYWNDVLGNFAAIEDAFVRNLATFDCKCKQNYYAYVYPNQPYKIYLCRVFWQAPAMGRDSRAGTLIHEMSHFNVVASTDDWVYGETGAKNLALTDPSKAVNNADNHEYFAEDQPE